MPERLVPRPPIQPPPPQGLQLLNRLKPPENFRVHLMSAGHNIIRGVQKFQEVFFANA